MNFTIKIFGVEVFEFELCRVIIHQETIDLTDDTDEPVFGFKAG